jgi:hypothetical protein
VEGKEGEAALIGDGRKPMESERSLEREEQR